jgi:hypothetical protein
VAVSFEPGAVAFSPHEAAILDEINANVLEGIVAVAQVCVCVLCVSFACQPAWGAALR